MLKLAIVLAALAVIRADDVSNTYHLYTLENHYEPEVMDPTVPFSRYSNFKITDNTVILVHGHQGSLHSEFNNLVKDAILFHQEPHNVIVVDWSREAGQGYTAARQSVPLVAHHLANFISWLETEARLIRSTLHLVGFNLGAHIVGQAGRRLDQGLGRVGRITGLDPAASRWGSDSGRLADSDAMYVEVIHTDITGPGSNGIGTAIGDINFFVNGGSNQPGCIGHVCNHNRAYEVFAASMSNSGLVGYPCSSDLQNTLNRCRGDPLHMGGLVLSKTGSKKYRVNTSGRWPY
ncbi:pancreatic lipase-related protein 2-like [Spodoptera frugiperda]|uniref:Pancreatic lipase-related protein 2-like n=1 Tax=Spodoptera frugiperda TaxID=7108 RepID=A0A9R0E9Y3_SPOFR|nr:pancreatic lipase-related protein 2-like [Spodoptera frugiperda]